MFREASNNSVKSLSLQLTDMPYSQSATMSATLRAFAFKHAMDGLSSLKATAHITRILSVNWHFYLVPFDKWELCTHTNYSHYFKKYFLHADETVSKSLILPFWLQL